MEILLLLLLDAMFNSLSGLVELVQHAPVTRINASPLGRCKLCRHGKRGQHVQSRFNVLQILFIV
jgi:hypothetical protein